MALTSITKDFVVKAGALIEGTTFVTTSTGQTGTLQVNGGAAIAQNLIVGTTATVWGDSNLVGKLTVTGNSTLGVLTATAITANSVDVLNTLDVTGSTFLRNILTVGGNTRFAGAVNTFSGALFVTGTNILTVGTGATTLGGTLTVAGKTLLNNSTTADVAGGGDGALKIIGGAYVGDNLIIASTAANTATSTGNALYVAGGAYIEKNLTVEGPALFKNEVTFAGTATYILSTNTFYTDNILEIHTPPSGVYGNWVLDDGKDIGFRFHYYSGGTDKNAALVLANDTKYLEFYGSGAEDSTGTFGTAVYGTFKTGNILLTGITNASSTVTGALQVVGGVGVGGTVYAGGLNAGDVTARNLTTASGVVYSIGGRLQNSEVTYNSALQQLEGRIAYSNTSTNLAGGAAGSVPYQTDTGQTGLLPIGLNGQVLMVGGGVPFWSVPSGLTAGSATTSSNIAGGLKDQIPYQSSPGQTTFSSNLRFNGSSFTTTNVVITGGSNSTGYSNGSGALQIAGGVGIAKDLWIGGNINLQGNLYLKGVGLDQITGSTATFDYTIIEGTGTGLYVYDSATIGGNLTATTVRVTGRSTLQDVTANTLTATNVKVTGRATIEDTVITNGTATTWNVIGSTTLQDVSGTTASFTDLYVSGWTQVAALTATVFTATSADILGDVTVAGTLEVTDYTTLGLLRADDTTVTNLTVTSNADVTGKLDVTGYSTIGMLRATDTTVTNLTVTGAETVTGLTRLNGGAVVTNLTATTADFVTLEVSGLSTLDGGAVVTNLTATTANIETLTVTGQSFLTGGTTTTHFTATTADITDNTTIGGSLRVTGRTTLGLLTATISTVTSLTVIGNESVGGTLSVTGRTIIGDVYGGPSNTITATNLVITGSASLPGNIILAALTVTNLTVNENETIGGNLQVSGLFTATGISNFTGLTTFSNVTDSNTPNSGAVTVLGGLGIVKNLTVGTAVTVGAVSTQSVVTALFSNNSLYSSYTSEYIVTNALIYLDTFSASSYRTAKYIIQIVDGARVHVEEMMLFHDGTDVYVTEYAIGTNTGELGSFDATLTAGTVTLTFTANYTPTNMTIKVARTSITL